MELKLKIPKEPKAVKDFIHSVRSQLGTSNTINWDPFVIWAGNKIPQYLWGSWKHDLRKEGFNWQIFLRLMKFRTDDAILWVYERISWEEFVRKVIESLEGPLGEALIEK